MHFSLEYSRMERYFKYEKYIVGSSNSPTQIDRWYNRIVHNDVKS